MSSSTQTNPCADPVAAPRDRLASELAAMTLLHDISTRFVQEGNTKSLFRQIVSAALEITGGDMGNIQILNPDTGLLEMVACCSLDMDMPACCKLQDKAGAACGIASERAERLIIDDVATSSVLQRGAVEALLDVGIRAVQATPLFTRCGRLVGVLSTHSRTPRALEESETRLLDMLARQIADIIENSQATEALKKSTERYRCLFENMLDGYCHCRMIYRDGVPVDFEYLAVNPAFERLTGLKDVVGKRISELIPNIRQDNPELFLIYGEVAQKGVPARFETYLGGLSNWFAIAVYRPAPGEFVAVFDNVTERKRLEAEVRKRRGEMEDLFKKQVAAQTAAAIAHDLNQPLVAISAYSEAALRMLQGGTPKPDKLARALEGSFEQAQRAGRTLHYLLDFLHNGETVPLPMDIGDCIDETIRIARLDDSRGGPRLHVDLAPELPLVLANRLQVQKVLDNLLHNGVEAMREAGVADMVLSISARVGNDGQMVEVSVGDNGPGIKSHVARRVFEPFYSTKTNGVGLGLAISHSLILAHGGDLWLDEAAGPGAVFRFTLPVAP